MICHIITSTEHAENDFKNLRVIAQVLLDNHVSLVHNWISVTKEGPFNTSDEDISYKENLHAIGRADIVIVEATHSTFAQGFLASLSLQHKKPTLVLSRESSINSLAASIHDRNLTTKTYAKTSELTDIIEEFINSNTLTANDLRFNFFISKDIHNYLRDAAHRTGKNKSEIIRDLLEREIKEQRL